VAVVLDVEIPILIQAGPRIIAPPSPVNIIIDF